MSSTMMSRSAPAARALPSRRGSSWWPATVTVIALAAATASRGQALDMEPAGTPVALPGPAPSRAGAAGAAPAALRFLRAARPSPASPRLRGVDPSPLAGRGIVLAPRPRRGPGVAFLAELREQTLRSRAIGDDGLIAMHMPEMVEDDLRERQSERAAQRILERAAVAALRSAFGRGDDGEPASPRMGLATVDSGFRFGSGPEWVVRRRGGGADVRLTIPLVPGAVRLRAWRDVASGSPNPRRVGASLAVDPFDRSVALGFSFQF